MNLILKGDNTQILLATERHKAVFAVVDLDFCQASHDEKSFAQNPKFPTTSTGQTINDRDYSRDDVAQSLVEQYAIDLEPLLLINTSPTSEGTPIINEKGIVVSGNNRIMSLKLAAHSYTDKYKTYTSYLLDNLRQFGLAGYADDIVSFFSDNANKAVVLVRIDYDAKITNTELLAKYNQSYMKGKSEVDKAIELSKSLSTNLTCSNDIPRIVAQFDTLPQLFADTKTSKLLFDKLINCNILTINEQKTYFSNGNFSTSGKSLIEFVLLAMVLQPQTLTLCANAGVKNITNKVISCLSLLMETKTLKATYNLISFVENCVKIAYQLTLLDISPNLKLETLLKSRSLFGDDEGFMYDFKSLVLFVFLQELPLKTFKDSIKGYNYSAVQAEANSLFGGQMDNDPDKAFNHYFVQKIVLLKDWNVIKRSTTNPTASKIIDIYNRSQDHLQKINNL